jgi:hypothetical protein
MADGMDDADFLALEKRDDSSLGLAELLSQEGLKVSDVLRVKRQVRSRV